MGTDIDTPVYIARCKCGCGAIVFAAVDNPAHAKQIAKDVGDCIRDGYAIERGTVGMVRSEPFGCRVKRENGEKLKLSRLTVDRGQQASFL